MKARILPVRKEDGLVLAAALLRRAQDTSEREDKLRDLRLATRLVREEAAELTGSARRAGVAV